MSRSTETFLKRKFAGYNWQLFFIVTAFSLLGLVVLYSAGVNEEENWAFLQAYTLIVFLPIMFILGLCEAKVFYDNAYLLYGLGLILLVIAEIMGYKAMGAQRWIRLGPINFQPSEFMKIFVVLALARYFHRLHSNEVASLSKLFTPIILVLIPAALILKQPNLGTATIILLIAAAIFFAAGVRAWKFISIIITALLSLPIIWTFLHDYQKKRVLTFLDPEQDPLGAGYNIIQSMIAIGSGGWFGKGYMSGTQSQLDFLPEKQTDFIFTILAEEFGFFGVTFTFALSILLLYNCYRYASTVKGQFQRLVIIGIATTFFVHLAINTAMISGLIPVVGTPFPFLSFARSNLITMLVGFGIMISACQSSKNQTLPF